MAKLLTLISQPGPLPITVTFNSEDEGNVIFSLSGSAWVKDPGPMGIELYLDDSAVGFCYGYSNETGSHKALVSVLLPWQITYGEHTLTLMVEGGSPAVTDENDTFNVSMIV